MSGTIINNEKKVYSGIDVFKLIAAILIVLLHTIETTHYIPSEIKFVCTRFAVPFFFICSGYFFALGIFKNNDSKSYFIHYEKKLLTIFLIWNIIYLPFVIKNYLNGYSGEKVIKIIALIFRRVFIIGAGPYWYLIALIISTAIIYLCYEKKLHKLLLLIMIVGFILQISYVSLRPALSNNVLCSIIFKSIDYIYSWEFNFIMYGIPFMGIGYFFFLKNINIKNSISVVIFIVSTVLRIVEYNLSTWIAGNEFLKSNQISVMFILQAISFFMISKNYQPCISKKTSCSLRQLSSFIYFVHAIILYNLLNPLLDAITNFDIYHGIWIPIKMLIVLTVCCIVFVIIKIINNKYLNVLING